ncbi:SusC/RagA family TonB-linked outer membrane protein [Anaerorudis cellulosivorans]|uniref:SusC/RagA family TonB-linked outer membrane protein n=1 Tax=Anaerorudis cellulosivorans TaxID=3397862 RepID=UPI00221F2367|nr:TonB-dependent receptor [Seramator thermalis]MCW1735717.1 TonB-dependent receptor [Seramator thermalis]
MRTSIILLFTCVFCSMAESTYTQEAKVSTNKRNVAVKEVLNEIEAQTDYLFIPNDEVNTDVLFAQQEKKTIAGKVVDIKGEPVIGANIVEVGTTNGTVTDVDGNFALEVADNAVIRVSYIGYLDQQINTAGKTNFNIVLQEDIKALEEVVVVGYGTQRKVNLTGAVDQVTSEVFENRPISNVTQALQGIVPNLNIKLVDGKPTRSSSYNVRGTTSIGQGGSALVLIDGVEGDPALLNPNDIESISVLKDAASAAIYGARGSFGVVLITTKTPQKGKITVNYSGSILSQTPTAIPDNVTDGYVYAERFREAYYAWNNYSSLPSKINKTQPYSDAWLETFKKRKEQGITNEVEIGPDGSYIYYGNTDWYDILYRDHSFAQDHNVTASGGSEKADFYLSGHYYDFNGLFNYNSDTYKMYNIRAKGSLEITKWLKISNNMEFSDMTYHNPINIGEGGSIWRNIADEGHPSMPVCNPDGSLTMSAAYTVGDFIYGKNWINTHKKILKNTTAFNASFLNNKLRVNGDFTFRNFDNNDEQKRVPVPYSNVQGRTVWLSEKYNDFKESIRNTFYTATNLYAEYENTFADDHYFKGMLGYNYETSKYESNYVQRNGLLLPDAENLNLALGESTTTSAGYEKWQIVGTFFRLNYNFQNRYLLEINGRYDGSSKFPQNQRYGFFPSLSGGWRISEEPFWKVDDSLISDMKIRASYGSLGNGNIGSYNFMELLSISTSDRVLNGALNKYTQNPAPIPSGLTWETATTFDIGTDIGLAKGRLQFTGDYYIRKTTDMYTVGMTLPEVFGATSPKGNYADMTTRGWELSVTWNDNFVLGGKSFNYQLRGTMHDYKSKIDRYNNTTKSLSDYYPGMTVGEIWGYRTDGLFQSQDEIEGYVNTIIKSSSNGTVYPGDIKFVDVNKNGKIDYGDKTVDKPGDMVIIGNSDPRYIYSLKLDADWNGFFLSSFFQGVGQQDWYPSNESAFWGQYNRPYNNLPKWHLNNYWTKDNRDAYLPRYAGYNTSLKETKSDRYLQNIAYIRLKNLQVGYSLPQHLISKISMKQARVFISGENLWSWSPLYRRTRDFDVTNTQGSDPDLTSSNYGDNYSYPLMKTISLGLSLTF